MLSEKIQNFQKCVKTYYFDTPTQKIMSDDVFRPNGAVSHDLTAENGIFEKINTKNMLFSVEKYAQLSPDGPYFFEHQTK